MPKLPSPDGQRATPRASGGVVDYGRRSDAGIQDAANTVGTYAREVQQREDQFAYASAKSNYLIEQSNTMRKLSEDPDYETYEERYVEASKKAIEVSGEKLRPRDREAFGLEISLQQQRGLEQMRDIAMGKKRDFRRGELVQKSNALINMFSDPATPQSIRSNIPDLLVDLNSSAALDGTQSPEEAERNNINMRSQAVEGLALTYIKTGRRAEATAFLATPEARLALSPQRLAELNSVNDDAATSQIARDKADLILEQTGGDPAATHAAVAKIPDVDEREKAQNYVDAALYRQKVVEADQQEKTFELFAEAMHSDPENGLANARALHPDLYSKLSTTNKTALEKAQRGDPATTDNMAFTVFNDTLRLEGPDAAKVFLQNNVGSLTPSLYRSLSERLSTTAGADQLLTITQRINDYKATSGLTDKDTALVRLEFERQLNIEKEEAARNEKTVSAQRENEILENLIVQNSGGLFRPTKRTVNLEGQEKRAQFSLSDNIRESLRQRGEEPTVDRLNEKIDESDAAVEKIQSMGASIGVVLTKEAALKLWLKKGASDLKDIK